MSNKFLKWVMPVVTAGFFMVASAAFGQSTGRHAGAAHKKANDWKHQGDLQYQRQQTRQRAKRIRSEAKMNDHAKPPKAAQHRMRKVQRRQSPNRRKTRKEARQHGSVSRTPKKHRP